MTYAARRRLSLAGVCACAMLAAPVPAQAENEGTITACLTRDGRIRVPSAHPGRTHKGTLCGPGERLLTWNIAGPAGPTGPPGPPGPAGPGFAGIQYYTVGAGDLRPAVPGIFGTSFGPPPGGSFSAAAAPLMAGIHVPQGARILAVRAHVFDNSASDLVVELIEQPLSGDFPAVLAGVTSSGAAAAAYAIDATLDVPYEVDNERFHYFARVVPAPGWTGTTMQIMGMTVAYTLLPAGGS